MAYFIGMRENAGTYEITDEKTGEKRTGDYHNFLLQYADVVDGTETTKNELDRTSYGVFEEKIKADMMETIFGFNVIGACSFEGAFLQEIELKFGRNGLSKVIFKDTSFLNAPVKDKKGGK